MQRPLPPGALVLSWATQLQRGTHGSIDCPPLSPRRATAEVAPVELALRSRLAEVFERYATATTRTRAYRDGIVPRAAESYRLFFVRYQEMAAAYPQVLIAQRTLFQASKQYLEALATSWRTAILIEGHLLHTGLATPFIPGERSAP